MSGALTSAYKLQKDAFVRDGGFANHIQGVLSAPVCAYMLRIPMTSSICICIDQELLPVGKKAGCWSCALASACW